jgi:hypothetical protein
MIAREHQPARPTHKSDARCSLSVKPKADPPAKEPSAPFNHEIGF